MQAGAGRANQGRQAQLDVHVQVFKGGIPGKFTALDFILHLAQAGNDAVGVVLRDNALLRQHDGVGLGTGDVLPVQPPGRSGWKRCSRYECSSENCPSPRPIDSQ